MVRTEVYLTGGGRTEENITENITTAFCEYANVDNDVILNQILLIDDTCNLMLVENENE